MASSKASTSTSFVETYANGLVSGALAGFVCDFSVHPVDTIRTRIIMQDGAVRYTSTWDCVRTIVRTEGVRALYRGAGIVWSLTIPGHATYFTVYELAKKNLEPHKESQHKGVTTHFVAGFSAEMIGALLWCPMDIIKQRQQAQRLSAAADAQYANVRAAVRTILREQGPRGLYTGYWAGLAVYGPYQGIYFSLYERIKRRGAARLGVAERDAPFGVHLVGGAGAGAVAAFVTTPFDVIKTRLQASVDANGRALHGSVLAAARAVAQADGARGFARGAAARVLWVAPGTAITMTAYEYFKRFFDVEFGWRPHADD